jgi:hypothetical protein
MPKHVAAAHMGLFDGQFNRHMAGTRDSQHERCEVATLLLYPADDPG